MKPILLCLLLSGCTTTVFRDGKPLLRTSANASRIVIDGQRVLIDNLNHSEPTRAATGLVREGGALVITASGILKP